MVERVNFLEKGKFVLTYKRMAQLAAAWFVFCFFIFLLVGAYNWWVGKSLEKSNKMLQELNVKKEKTMALLEATKSGQTKTNVKQLSEVYSNFPEWSQVMLYLSRDMPPQTWLSTVSSDYVGESNVFRKIEIRGEGQNTASIAKFVGELNRSPLFRNVVLNKSERKEEDKRGSYTFVVLGEVIFKEKKWN